MSKAKIGKVTLKDGGATLSLLPTPEMGELSLELLTRARQAVNSASESGEIVGFALVALKADGSFYSSARSKFTDTLLMNRHAFVGMVTEAVRDDLLAYETAREVVNRSNGYEP